ncbi:MAG: type II secretion system F family protein [Candidatus Omnitrophica bacterium]|nr:type II secretion system F family protein [Candidatus Omnitrophota bacterium]
MEIGPLIIFFILVVAAFFLISLGLFSASKTYLRLREEGATGKKKPFSFKIESEALSRAFKPLGFIINPVYKRLTYLNKLKYQTEILRIDLNIFVLVGIKIILFIVFGCLGYVFLLRISPIYTAISPFVGFFLPDFLIWRKVKRKKEEIVRCFPETVDLLHMCINAGADLISAIKWVIDKSMYNPFIEQLAIVLSEVQVGKPRAEALRYMAKKLQLADISSFSRVIVQAERMGTPVEEAFKNLSDDTRDRRYQNGERFAIKASLKILFPLVFCILPAIMIIVAGPIIIKFTQGDMLPTTF